MQKNEWSRSGGVNVSSARFGYQPAIHLQVSSMQNSINRHAIIFVHNLGLAQIDKDIKFDQLFGREERTFELADIDVIDV